VLVGLKELNFRHPQSEMWKLIEPSGHYQTIQTEWDEPRPGIPFLVPLLWRHPDELVREVFRFTSYKVWINGASSTRNRTCYTGFALMNLALLKNMSSWIGFIPKTFSIQSIVESPAALYVDTVSEKKFSSSQHGLPPQPVPLPLSSQQELNRNSLRQDVRQLVHSVSERTNPFETTTLGHVFLSK
jgi:hypothetical protein